MDRTDGNLADVCRTLRAAADSDDFRVERSSGVRVRPVVEAAKLARVLYAHAEGDARMGVLADVMGLSDAGNAARIADELASVDKQPISADLRRSLAPRLDAIISFLEGTSPRVVPPPAVVEPVEEPLPKEPLVSLAEEGPPPLRPMVDVSRLWRVAPSSLRDPEAKRVAAERSVGTHQEAVEVLRSFLSSRGIACEYSDLIDLTCLIDRMRVVFEVKSVNEDTEREQVRAAFAELHDYAYIYRRHKGFGSPLLSVVLSQPPSLRWTKRFLTMYEVTLLWVEDGRLAGGGIADLP